jgi:iron complex outermembrane receptor protein
MNQPRISSFGRLNLSAGLTRATLAGASLLVMSMGAAQAQEAGGADEIIVTAQKREQALNDVPISVTALDQAALDDRGLSQIDDLGRAVPGFSYTESRVGSPIYTLRGVGFNDIALGGRPTVSVYHDEAPVPFTIETRGGFLDLQRVEVLSGPQGTLFGQNATGGAINLIAARPQSEFGAGIEAGYGNFNAMTLGGHLTGPVTEALRYRIALQHQRNDGMQENFRTGEQIGALDLTTARAMLEWTPTRDLEVTLNVNGFVDRSESQIPQVVAITPSDPLAAPLIPGLLTQPLGPDNNTDVDFTPDDYARDNRFVQANLRLDYALNENLTLTSLSSYSTYDQEQVVDIDGMAVLGLQQYTRGDIESFYQELRLAGDITDRLYFVVGANYASDSTREFNFDDLSGSTQSLAFTPLGLPVFETFTMQNDQDIETTAVFGAIEYSLTNTLTLQAGARYTETINDFQGCTRDAGDGVTAQIFTGFINFLRGLNALPAITPIAPGGCVSANGIDAPPLLITDRLDEDNVSWRIGLDWQPHDDLLVYANASRGYKAGGFPTLGATQAAQYEPTLQEELTAYEVGVKIGLADALQLNGAIYHYDYADKQVLGFVFEPALGELLRLVNVPQSEVNGAELQLVWSPIDGLDMTGAVSYVTSEITGSFPGINADGDTVDFAGGPFPNTPEWQLSADIAYAWPISPGLSGFVGIGANHRTATNAELGEVSRLEIDGYTLVDLRAGLEADDGRWRVSAWVRNVTDEYYYTNASSTIDALVRYTGAPRTYGVTLSYDFGG